MMGSAAMDIPFVAPEVQLSPLHAPSPVPSNILPSAKLWARMIIVFVEL